MKQEVYKELLHSMSKCNKCTKNCPMNVDMLNDSKKRKNGTECILCFKCIKECPKKALKI